MTNEQPVNNAKKSKKLDLEQLSILLLFFFQCLFLLCFLLGSFSTENGTISLLTAIDKVVDVFSINSALWYYYLSSFVEGVAYFIVVVLLIKYFTACCRYSLPKKNKSRLLGAESSFQSTYQAIAIYLAILCALNEGAVGGMATFLLIVGLLVFVGEKALNIYCNHSEPTWQHVTTECCYLFFKGLLFLTLGGFVFKDVVYGIINGIGCLFTSIDFSNGLVGLYSAYQLIVVYFFHLLLIVYFFLLVNETLNENDDSLKDYWKKTLVIAAVYLAIDFVLFLALANGDNVGIADIISDYLHFASETVLPIFLLCLTGFLSCTFERYPAEKLPIAQPVIQQSSPNQIMG